MPRDPYCGNCTYSLKGLTESSKCPECGRPLVEVLERGPIANLGRRFRSETRLFGLPLLDIAYGPSEDEASGHARGIIALGDRASGWLAVGGRSRGIIAIGGRAVGVVAFGGIAIGLLSFGGISAGLLAWGGLVLGGLVSGGSAGGGVVAGAGIGLGYYVNSGLGFGAHVLSGARRDPQAIEFFNSISGLLGSAGLKLPFLMGVGVFLLAVGLFLVGFGAYLLRKRRQPDS